MVRPQLIMACGPTPMLKQIQSIANERNIACQIFRRKNGCGIGACMVCSAKEDERWFEHKGMY